MNRRSLARSIIAFPASVMALHAMPDPAEAKGADAALTRCGGGGPDIELLSLCRRYLGRERRFDRLFEIQCAAEEAGDKERAERVSYLQTAGVEYSESLLNEIVHTPARTPAGLLAKAEVCMSRVQTWADGTPMHGEGPIWSLCRDLLGDEPVEGGSRA